MSDRKFAVTVKQSPETDVPLEEAIQELGLVLLPRAKALWESWLESGLLTVEEGDDGRYWTVGSTPSQADAGD